ncbi:hypothetical protein CNO08_23670 [Lysobacter capsici]|nr:hypothetical protein CNO08_23670 [Lysobacter capsici]
MRRRLAPSCRAGIPPARVAEGDRHVEPDRPAVPPLRLRNLPAARLLSGAVLAATAAVGDGRLRRTAPHRGNAQFGRTGRRGRTDRPGRTAPHARATHLQRRSGKAALVGKTADAATVERARTQAGGHTVRVLKPGQAITKEYMDGRVNVHVDENNVIVDVGCG